MSCNNPKYKLLVYFIGHRSSTEYFRINDNEDPYLNLTYYDNIHDSVGWLPSNGAATTIAYGNISCPEDFVSSGSPTCGGSNPLYNPSHKLANIFASVMDVSDTWGEYPDRSTAPLVIRFSENVGGGGSVGQDYVVVGDNAVPANGNMVFNNHQIAHEIGHFFMKRKLDLGTLTYILNPEDPNDPNEPENSCGGHSWHYSTENGSENCGTAEGWADFFAAATYFNSNAVSPFYNYCGDDFCGVSQPSCNCLSGGSNSGVYPSSCHPSSCIFFMGTWNWGREPLEGQTWNWGYTYLDPDDTALYNCVCGYGNCDKNSPEGNIARYFWDLYDSTTNGDSADSVTWSRADMMDVWEDFPAGYNNLQNNEPHNTSGSWDNHNGRNGVDYRKVECNYGTGHCNAHSIFDLNCLTSQDGDD